MVEKPCKEKTAAVIFTLVLLLFFNFAQLENTQRDRQKWAYQTVAVVDAVLPDYHLTGGNGHLAVETQIAEDDNGSTSADSAENDEISPDDGSDQVNAKEQVEEHDNESSSPDTEKDSTISPSMKEGQPNGIDKTISATLSSESATSEPRNNDDGAPDAPTIDEEALEERRQQAYLQYGTPKNPPLLDSSVPFANFSHIRFYGAAGLGHRLIRHAAAMYQGRLRGMAVRGFWSKPIYDVPDHASNNGNSDGISGKRDLFAELFEPFTRDDFTYVNTTNRYVAMFNEVSGATNPIDVENPFVQMKHRKERIKKVGKSGLLEGDACACTYEEFQVYYDFFISLREKYRKRHIVEAFRAEHRFEEHTVVGIHVRAGNGEKGDFMIKKRGIKYNPTLFVQSTVEAMLQYFGFNTTTCGSSYVPFDFEKYPPMIFLATDDPAYRDHFRKAMDDVQQRCGSSELIVNDSQNGGIANFSWSIVTLDQEFRGNGVVLRATTRTGDLALWHSMFQDSLILSSSDIVIATKYSSFPQTLPAILTMGKPSNERKTEKNGNKYCEVIDVTQGGDPSNNTKPELQMYCHDQLMKWCCQTSKLIHTNTWKFHNLEYRGTVQPHLEEIPFEPFYYLSFDHTVTNRTNR